MVYRPPINVDFSSTLSSSPEWGGVGRLILDNQQNRTILDMIRQEMVERRIQELSLYALGNNIPLSDVRAVRAFNPSTGEEFVRFEAITKDFVRPKGDPIKKEKVTYITDKYRIIDR